jgi:hypothetical protein
LAYYWRRTEGSPTVSRDPRWRDAQLGGRSPLGWALHPLVRWTGWLVPPTGFEPAHPAPEAGALSPELRGRAS